MLSVRSSSAGKMSSSSTSSESDLAKKRVGGSCCESPTTMSCLPRRIAQIASSGQTCDASSKITSSNNCSPFSTYWLTLSGLIHPHGKQLIVVGDSQRSEEH